MTMTKINLPVDLRNPGTAGTSLVPAQRIAPHNLEIEQALLGVLLSNRDSYDKVGDLLKPEYFYDPVHGRIYQAILTLRERGQLADDKTLRGYFENDPALASVGGATYLTTLVLNVVSIINAVEYAQLIHELYLRRQLITLGEDVVNDAFVQDVERNAKQQIEETEARLFNLAESGEQQRGFVRLDKSLAASVRNAEVAYKRDSHVTGVTTGLRDLDRRLGGLQKSDLIILAGRPAMGKTALATNIAINAATRLLKSSGKEGAGVAFFSLEMSAEQLATRLLGEFSEVPSDKIRRGELKQEDFHKFLEVLQSMSSASFFVDDSPGLSISAVRTRTRRLKRQVPSLGLVVVDYLQLLRGSSTRGEENRVQEISEITRGLKGLAKELDLPVLALSQLSRNVENREDKRPQLADLRESGSIEQDADIVMFVYRDEYYHATREPKRRDDESEQKFNDRYKQWQDRGEQVHNVAEVIIAKQRHGPTGTVPLHFDGRYTRFSDLEKHYEVPGE